MVTISRYGLQKEENNCFLQMLEPLQRKSKKKVKSTIKQLLYSKFKGNTVMKWGLLQEQPTKAKYLEEKQYHHQTILL